MIYNYHCLDCGNLLRGEEISFDLGQMVGIDVSSFSLPANALLLSSEQTLNLIKESQEANVPIRNMERVRVSISLHRFLSILVTNMARLQNPNAYVDKDLVGWTKDNLQECLEDSVFCTGQNDIIGNPMVANFIKAIEVHFPLSGKAERFISEHAGDEQFAKVLHAIQNSLANYQAIIYVEPEFFKDEKGSITDKLYTVAYTSDWHAAVAKRMSAPFDVRGFCPKCGKPVISGAGKYQHILIGLVGVQNSGKASLLISLERALLFNNSKYGVRRFPPFRFLCDSRFKDMQQLYALYDGRFVVNKANATNTAAFSASLQVFPGRDYNENKRKLISFVDIPSEKCYDIGNHRVKNEAFQIYPLIKSCDIYLLCTSINQGACGNVEGRDDLILPEVSRVILSEIYATIEREQGGKGFMPPLAVIFTKADLAVVGDQMAEQTPLDELTVNREYRLNNSLQDVGRCYHSTDVMDIRESIERACHFCNTMGDRTYTAMMYCSALGRLDEPCSDSSAGNEETIKSREAKFVSSKLDDIWKWLLEVIGVSPYRGEGIPNWHGNLKGITSVEEARQMVNEHKSLFMNLSPTDRKLYDICTVDIGSLPLRKRFFESQADCRERNLRAYVNGEI